jgi:hypothetical protein
MTAAIPRVAVVTRPTEYAALLARHGTREQARFFLATRGRAIEELEAADDVFRATLAAVSAAVPTEWRRVKVDRGDLDRFLFEPDDLIVAVGQDGLVANVAKYLAGQAVIGCNPDPSRYEGILVPHSAAEMKLLVPAAMAGKAAIGERSMVEAVLDDGLRALLDPTGRSKRAPEFVGGGGHDRHRRHGMGPLDCAGAPLRAGDAGALGARAGVLRPRGVAVRLHRREPDRGPRRRRHRPRNLIGDE